MFSVLIVRYIMEHILNKLHEVSYRYKVQHESYQALLHPSQLLSNLHS